MFGIRKYEGFGDYQEGISRYSVNELAMTFAVQETGRIDEEQRKEKSYMLYVFNKWLTEAEARKLFIEEYCRVMGFDKARIMDLVLIGSDEEKREYAKVRADADKYAKGLHADAFC